MNRYCIECLKLAKDDCDGTQPRPTSDRGRIFTVNGRRHGKNYCRGYEFNPQHLPPILSNAGTHDEFKEKIKRAKVEGKRKKAEEKERKAHARKAERLKKKLDAAEAMVVETLAEAAAQKGAKATVKVPAVDEDGLPTLGDLDELLI